MWAALENLLRRARLRKLKEGPVQQVRTESFDNEAKDQAERWQDYGFAAHPLDGQGLILHAGGHTIVLRMDRIAERPQLQEYEVAVWHKEGHRITLKAGGLIELQGTTLNINMSGAVAIQSASLSHNGKNVGSTHRHTGVSPGLLNTGGPA